MASRQIPGFCTLCRSRCGTLNTVEDGRLVRVDANPAHPTGRAICTKGRAAPEIAHGSRRLLTPLRRTRPKTDSDPGWQPVTWDAAMTDIAARLAAQRAAAGAESVAFAITSPSASSISDANEWIDRFIRLFGSPNTAYSTEICNWHKDVAHAFTYGKGIGTPDYAHADLILLWGHNPASVWLAQAGAVAEGRRAGAKLMVIDPRRTPLAGQADHWLQVRPGTDAALALGLLRQVIATAGFDADFVRRWTNGPFLVRDDNGHLLSGPDGFMVFDDATQRAVPAGMATAPALRGAYSVDGVACRPAFDLLAEACDTYTPDMVAAITWVSAPSIIAAAAAIAAAKSVSYYCWTGVGQHADATQTDRAIAILMALTGTHDVPGGNRDYARQHVNAASRLDLLAPEQAAKALGLAERPLGPPAQGWVTAAALYDAILDAKPYAVQALVSFGANLQVSHADPHRAQAALQALPFHVHCDLIETPTARFADYLLPVNSPWEREGLRVGFEIDEAAEELIQLRARMIEPLGESRSDMQIVFDLAVRLGMGNDFFGGKIEAAWDHVLQPTGLSVAKLRDHPEGLRRPVPQQPRAYANRTPAFPTETGLVELYSEKFLRHGYAPLPIYGAPPEGPDDRFPLVLTTAKSGYFCHSEQRGIASLRRRATEPMAAFAPALAASRGIADGDWVALRSRVGTAQFRAKLDPALHPGVVVADYGWWQACAELAAPGFDPVAPDGSNFNNLISADHSDPISGSVPHRSFACELERVAGSAQPGWRPMRVAALATEADDVVSVTLTVAAGTLADYRPGQHLPIRLDGVTGHGVVTRSYSLSGPAVVSNRDHYRITVKTVPGGAGSSHITRALKIGDIVQAGRPGGRFIIPLTADFPVVLIAGGIGITPFIAALETLAADPPAITPRIVLHYGNRNAAGHAFRARLRALEAALPTLTVIDHYSRPGPAEDFDRPGRITADSIAPDLIAGRARFYLCGPAAMLRDLPAGLIARGVPRFEIFQEAFGSAPASAAPPAADVTHQVRFDRSDRVLTWRPADGTLLDFAEANGLTPPSGCRVGQCESCAVPVLAGSFRYLTPLDSDEPETCMTCQAAPTADLVLDA